MQEALPRSMCWPWPQWSFLTPSAGCFQWIFQNKELQEEYDAALAKCSAAEVSAHNVGAEIDLIAPLEICKLEAKAHDKATTCEPDTENEFLLVRARLRIAMRYDLQDLDIPEDNERSKLAKIELETKALLSSGKHILGS